MNFTSYLDLKFKLLFYNERKLKGIVTITTFFSVDEKKIYDEIQMKFFSGPSGEIIYILTPQFFSEFTISIIILHCRIIV